jgi:predicted small secreted protein
MAKRMILVLTMFLVLFALTGCQTVQGIGGDIKWAGEKGAEVLE